MAWWPFCRATRQPAVVLFTRAGCHLCDEVKAVLDAERVSTAFDLRVIDVDSDPDSREAHGLDVPVVSIDGRVRFRGRVNAILLRRTLRAAALR